MIVSSPCLLLFPGMPRTRCDTNKFKFACLVCTIYRFDSRSSCSLFVHNLTQRIELACAFSGETPEKKKPLCSSQRCSDNNKRDRTKCPVIENTSNQIAFYLHLLWFCLGSFCLLSSPLQDLSDLRCRGSLLALCYHFNDEPTTEATVSSHRQESYGSLS